MVQIVGTYEFVSEENYEAYLIAIGVKEEDAHKVAQLRSPIIISALDDTTITASYAGKQVVFTLNQETAHTLSTGSTIRTTASVNGDTVTFKTKSEGGLLDERVFKITDAGLTSTSSAKGVVAVRQYKRT